MSDTKKEVRIGLIGAGWMGKAHTVAYRNAGVIFGDDLPILELVSDVNEAQVKVASKLLGYNRWTTNWVEVVTDPDVDLVDVSTPNSMHFEMIKLALENGKHVFSEKPLSLSGEESRILADLAKEKGVVNYCGFSNVMNPANQYVKELVDTGKLGKIMRIHATYDQDMLLDPEIAITWRHKKALAGTGALGDLTSHLLSVSQFILGDIEEVIGIESLVIPTRPVEVGSSEHADVETEDLATFLVRYKSGIIGDFTSSRVATGRKNYFYYEIQGTEGTVVYDLERMGEVQVYFKSDADVDNARDAGFRTVLLNPNHAGFKWFQPAAGIAIAFDDMKTLQAHELLQALSGAPYASDFEMGAKVDSVVSAVKKSIETRQWETC
ncbi:MAG: Gfo/Idh/MocA family oxidoreductase [Clostridiales Family XIII bacterium]|nr:Gfo/Idh/MocA family oxidoreductase [Clostridiales Family XIII bacterium]